MTLRTPSVVPAMVLVASCTNAGPVRIDELAPALAEVTCAKTFECCTPEQVAARFDDFGDPPTNQAECEALVGGFVSLGVSQLMQSVAAGRVVYHEDLAGECLSAVESLPCGGVDGPTYPRSNRVRSAHGRLLRAAR